MSFDTGDLALAQHGDAPLIFVDDDPEYVTLMREYAQRLGTKVAIIARSLDVVPAMIESRHKARLLVTDLQMPVVDGLEIAQELKALGSATEVVIVTSDPASRRAAEAKSLGYDVRAKPMDLAGFRRLLAPVISAA